MKRNMKSFAAGMAAMLVLMTAATAFGAPVKKNIQAVIDSIKTITSNGNSVAVAKGSQVITYNNVIYVPVTAVSDATCKNVKWDSKTGKLDISGIKISNAEKDAVLKAVDLNMKHFNDKDIDAFMGDYSGTVDKAILESYKSSALQQFGMSLSVTVTGKSIIAYDGNSCDVRYTQEVKQGFASAGKATVVQKTVKEKGKWKMTYMYVEKSGS